MEGTVGMWVATMLVAMPLVGWLLWWWNELWYVRSLKAGCAASSTKVPPGHMGFPFFGDMLAFIWYFKIVRRPDEYIESMRQRFGDGIGMFRTHLFGSPVIIAISPSITKYVLQSEELFKKHWPNVDILGENNLVSVHGKAHARLRNFITNAINKPDALRRIAVLVQPHVADTLKSWAVKGRIKAYDETKKLTFENIGKLFVSFEPGPLLHDMDQWFEAMLEGIRAQPLNLPGTAYRRALEGRKKLVNVFGAELENRRNKHNGIETTQDLMEGLMQIKDEEGNQLRDEEIIDNIVGLVVAAYSSTALTSMWAIYYLAKFPNVLQKLREENAALSLEKKGEFITYEDVMKLKYTNKVVEETIRLANVVAFMFRVAAKDVEYKGYIIPKNWKVFLWVRYIHISPEHFEDPLCFNPERWNKPAKAGAFQAFGGGPRICAGNMFARMQLSIFLHHLSVGYKWELVNPNAELNYLPHPRPVDGAESVFSKVLEAN